MAGTTSDAANPTTLVAEMTPGELRRAVTERYGQVASAPDGEFNFPVGRAFAEAVGYPAELLDALPAATSAAFAGVACVAPRAGILPGERVVDLGCGAGLDTVIAARAAGPDGRVDAVDVSAAMVARARGNVLAAGLANVTVHEAAVETLPLADASASVALANGVFNLAPEKARAAAEVVRVLEPGGRLVGAEIVLTKDIPRAERASLDDWFR